MSTIEHLISYFGWWFWLALGVGGSGVVLYFTRSLKLAALTVLAALGAGKVSGAYRNGWNAREQKLKRDNERALDELHERRAAAGRLSDAELDRANSKWLRPENGPPGRVGN